MDKRVFIDCDGVLYNLREHIRAAGLDVGDESKYDFFTPEIFHFLNSRTIDWWMSIPLYGHAKPLIQLLKGMNKVYVTFPFNEVMAAARFMLFRAQEEPYMMTNVRYLIANENTLLIDDCDVNVGLWRRFGGKAILLPQRYNDAHAHFHRPLGYVGEQLEALKW